MVANPNPATMHTKKHHLHRGGLAFLALILLMNFGLFFIATAESRSLGQSIAAWFLLLCGIFVVGGLAINMRAENLPQTQQTENSQDTSPLPVLKAYTPTKHAFKFDTVFHRELENVRRYGGLLSAIALDIANFHTINEEKGYSTGDAILTELEECITKHMKKAEFLFRWRGGKYILLLPHVKEHEAIATGNRLQKSSMVNTFASAAQPFIHIAVTQAQKTDTMETFLQRLHKELDQAKKTLPTQEKQAI